MSQVLPGQSGPRTSPAPSSGVQTVAARDDVWIPSVCRMCGNSCGIRIHRVNGVVVKIEGNPDNPHNFGKICAKGNAAIMGLYDPDRPRSCLRRTNPRKGPDHDPGWQEISWEDAVEQVVMRLRKIAAEDPRKLMFASGIAEVDMPSTIVATFADAFGTPNFGTGVFFGTHTRSSYLTTGSMHTEPDFDYCRLLLLFGSQKGSVTGHDAMKSAMAMADARQKGMKVVAFDPVCSIAASKADEWIPLVPGTDGAVALAMLHVLLNELRIMDEAFLARQTNAPYLVEASGHYARDAASGKPLVWDLADGQAKVYDDGDVGCPALGGEFQVATQTCRPALELLRAHVAQLPPERAEAISTVPAKTLRRLAREFGEAAQIGSTIAVDGVRMPFRPVCAFSDSRGSTCHSQGLWTGTAIQLLDIIVGAMDVPGSSISTNIIGPHGRPRIAAGPDGMIASGAVSPNGDQLYPGRTPRAPETIQLHELFPIGRPPRPMLGLALLDYPHVMPNPLEMLVLLAGNVMMSGADPQRMAQALEKVPFIVGLGERIDETLECADLVFPIAAHQERLDFPVNDFRGWVTGRHWYFTARHPAVDPPPGVRHVTDVVLEWADRLGLLPEINRQLNTKLAFSADDQLQPDRRYTNDELVGRRMRSMFGPDHDRRWFKEHGLVAWERSLAERYPRGVLELPRVPVYFPHILDRGRELKAVLDELHLDWDLSPYQPVPVCGGCWSHRERQPDQLYLVDFKLPFMTSTTTQGNPWLMDLAERHRLALYVTLNRETASRRGIADGDEVELVGTNGYSARGVARVAEGVHPDVAAVASCFGHWSRSQPVSRGKGVHFNAFIPLRIDGMEMLSGDYDQCALVTVRRIGKGRAAR